MPLQQQQTNQVCVVCLALGFIFICIGLIIEIITGEKSKQNEEMNTIIDPTMYLTAKGLQLAGLILLGIGGASIGSNL